jgi:two-component system OmpR family sensor kinase
MGADVLASHQNPRPRPWAGLKQLSDRTPLRTKLITAVLALVIMALIAISVASVFMLRNYVTTQHDIDLRQSYNQISLRNTQIGYASPTNSSDLILGIQQPGSQLTWTPTNGFPSLGGNGNQEPLPVLPANANWADSNAPVLITVPAQSGPDTWRVIGQLDTSYPTLSANGTPQLVNANVILAVNLGNVGAMTHRLVLFDLTVGGAIVVILAAVGVALVRANLRPLDDIEMTAGEIAKGRLDHRIPERDPRTEIGRLGRSLNIMLSQIEAAFHAQEESEQAAHASEERMRRFIADASHELRTPLTTIRGFAEYYRQRGGVRKVQNPSLVTDGGASAPANGHSPGGLDPEDLDRLMQRLESEATRMGFLVEDLLQLARLDQQRPLDMAPVDLLTLAADTVQDARIVAPGRPVDLVVAPGAAFLVEGDEQRLRQVLANLVNNALTHTPPGTPVRVKIASGTLIPPVSGRPAARPNGGSTAPPGQPRPAVVLDVEDDGPGMTAEQAQRVFERFYRADQARNRASGGTGLGLAIVAGLVAAHGGTVSVRTAPGRGADFQVRLPLSPDAQVDEPDDEDSPAGAF